VTERFLRGRSGLARLSPPPGRPRLPTLGVAEGDARKAGKCVDRLAPRVLHSLMPAVQPRRPEPTSRSERRPNRVWSLALPCLLLGGFVLVAQDAAEKAAPAEVEGGGGGGGEASLLSGVRQLTFDGVRAGEGYFSADGTKLVFQSEREEGNPFYQIYLLDLETGDTERVSPGLGKTTCAWIHPDGKRVLFASTHANPESEAQQRAEYEERESGKARKYAWDYDAEFEIYETVLGSGEYRNLTNTQGYDAEGCYSPDGTKIVFASNRQAYDGSMGEEDRLAFKLDKKFPMEIYLANADGSGVERLTHADGYDGGPFFSADGRQVCWRRFDRKGVVAEVYAMDLAERRERQLTRLGAMSWAPFFHPSGEYLIFSTNLHGFDNFELYLVDAAGEKEPVRVTHTPGFDGLPAFSPDGRTLAWTSARASGGQSQIFLAGWDHEAALALLEASGPAKGPAPSAASADAGQPAEAEAAPVALFETRPEINEADLRAHLEYLASPELRGRLTGTPGEVAATAHVAAHFERWGLEPGGDDGTFFQPFSFTAGVAVGKNNALTLNLGGEILKPEVEKDWRPVSFSKLGALEDSGIVFAGYGLEIPDGKGGESYTSYFHLDVKGKWVMVLRYVPENVPKERRQEMQRYSRLRHKATLARRKFAAGIIYVTGPNTQVNEELVPMEFDASLADSGIPAISISTELASKLVAAAGKDFSAVQKALDEGEMVEGFEIPGARLSATVDVEQETRIGRNVIGILSAGQTGPHPNPAVMVGAHIDHLGDEAGPGSLARTEERGHIHFGADDNASGVAGLLEIAEHLADQRRQGRLDLKRDVVFAAWSGEEIGLLGSSHFVRKLAKEALGDESAPLGLLLSSYLNMDMIGRLRETLVLQGVGSSDYWKGAIESRNAPVGLPITIQSDTYLPTDATPFYLRQVPILSAFTGAHEEYHTPRDTPDLINYEGAAKIARLMGLIARGLAIDTNAPKYLKVDPPTNTGGRGFRVFLGTIPDYSQGDIKGVKLSGVSDKGPAGVAGVKGGDVIVGLGDRQILNIYDYTEAMADLKVGEETSITIRRGEEEMTLKLVPASRD
jgi:Tol biopolymer transport system component